MLYRGRLYVVFCGECEFDVIVASSGTMNLTSWNSYQIEMMMWYHWVGNRGCFSHQLKWIPLLMLTMRTLSAGQSVRPKRWSGLFRFSGGIELFIGR